MSIAKGVDSNLFNEKEKTKPVTEYTEYQKLFINHVLLKEDIETVGDAIEYIQQHHPDVFTKVE